RCGRSRRLRLLRSRLSRRGRHASEYRAPTLEEKIVPVSRRRFLRTAVQGSIGVSLAALAWRNASYAQPAAGGPALPAGFRLLSLGATNVLAVSTEAGFVLV